MLLPRIQGLRLVLGRREKFRWFNLQCLSQTKEGFHAWIGDWTRFPCVRRCMLWGDGVANVGVEMCRRWVLDLSYRTNIRWQWVGDSQADTVGA